MYVTAVRVDDIKSMGETGAHSKQELCAHAARVKAGEAHQTNNEARATTRKMLNYRV